MLCEKVEPQQPGDDDAHGRGHGRGRGAAVRRGRVDRDRGDGDDRRLPVTSRKRKFERIPGSKK